MVRTQLVPRREVNSVASFRERGQGVEGSQSVEPRNPRIREGEIGPSRETLAVAQGEGEEASVVLQVQVCPPKELHLGRLQLVLQLLQVLGPFQEGPGARKAQPRAPQVATHVLQSRGHQEALVVWWSGRGEEQAGRSPGCRLASSPGPGDPAALALDVPVQVIRAGEALVAELALVGTDAGVDPHVVFQVVVVDEPGAAVDAEVRPFPRVLPHVDLQLVLPARGRSKG